MVYNVVERPERSEEVPLGNRIVVSNLLYVVANFVSDICMLLTYSNVVVCTKSCSRELRERHEYAAHTVRSKELCRGEYCPPTIESNNEVTLEK